VIDRGRNLSVGRVHGGVRVPADQCAVREAVSGFGQGLLHRAAVPDDARAVVGVAAGPHGPPNVLARGKDIESDAVYFTHELEAIIGRRIALDYRRCRTMGCAFRRRRI
jgi:hypothetical protein